MLMPSFRFAAWPVAAMLLIGCGALAPCRAGDGPSLAAVQAAYDDAKTEDGASHVDGLTIREADCQHDSADAYSCQITFTASAGAAGRLYFDVIGLDRLSKGWKLVSGLCKRHD